VANRVVSGLHTLIAFYAKNAKKSYRVKTLIKPLNTSLKNTQKNTKICLQMKKSVYNQNMAIAIDNYIFDHCK